MASQITANIIKNGEPVDILYGRLSQEDDHAGDSNSIVNQRSYLEKYAADNGFQNPVFMADDGYSGTNFDRPAWQDIVTLIEAGLVRTLIVKDMSRLGREYLKVGELTELYFPSKGVRFIAVNDGVDSLVESSSDFNPIRNWAKNISHSGKVSNDFSHFRRFCCINRCFRCSCGKFSIVHGVQAAIGFPAAAIGEKRDLPETHPVQQRTESRRPCRLTRAKPASKGLDRALSV